MLPHCNKVISKFISDSPAFGLIVTPYWPSAAWYATLLSMLIDIPFLLPAGYVQDEATLLPRHCRFLAWPIGCDLVMQQALQERLPLRNYVVSTETPFALLCRTNAFSRGLQFSILCGVRVPL